MKDDKEWKREIRRSRERFTQLIIGTTLLVLMFFVTNGKIVTVCW